jgi:hypothetical protein
MKEVQKSEKRKEDKLVEDFLKELNYEEDGFLIGSKIPILYNLSINENGTINYATDPDSGEFKRGAGKGFEQDILIYQKCEGVCSRIPRLIIEMKYGPGTSHDAIVYSAKAQMIKNVFPYVRYGYILGARNTISPKVIRLGPMFDFILAIKYPFDLTEINEVKEVIKSELEISMSLSSVLMGKKKVRVYRKCLQYK